MMGLLVACRYLVERECIVSGQLHVSKAIEIQIVLRNISLQSFYHLCHGVGGQKVSFLGWGRGGGGSTVSLSLSLFFHGILSLVWHEIIG